MTDWIYQFLNAIVKYFTEFFVWLFNLLKDILLNVFDWILTAITAAINSLGVPDFVTTGLQSTVDSFPSFLLYLCNISGLTIGFGLIGSAYAYRFIRKLILGLARVG